MAPQHPQTRSAGQSPTSQSLSTTRLLQSVSSDLHRDSQVCTRSTARCRRTPDRVTFSSISAHLAHIILRPLSTSPLEKRAARSGLLQPGADPTVAGVARFAAGRKIFFLELRHVV